jgi:GTP cyclohydrolase I
MTERKLPHKLASQADWDVAQELLDAAPAIDQEKIRRAVSMILEAVGEDLTREGLQETPNRVARMYTEIFAGLHQDGRDVLATRFHVDHEELVLVKDIHFYSLCEHHLLPFFGVAHVAYLPNRGVVTGLSKLARLVEVYARRPQVQERMTNQIADVLDEELKALGVFVMVQAEHLCMSMRGIQKPGSRTVTTAARGVFNSRPELRNEMLGLIQS